MANTTKHVQNSRLNAQKIGDFGDFSGVEPRKTPPRIVEAFLDQSGCRWLKIQQDEFNAIIKLTDLHGSAHEAVSSLSKAGIVVVTSSSIRKLADAAEAWGTYHKRLVADRPGWIGDGYILGDGTAFLPSNAASEILNLVEPEGKFSVAGSLKGWLKTFTPLIADQDAVMVALSFAFIPPLLEIVSNQRVQNPIWDICGESTKGKSTVFIIFAGSIWGWTPGDTGFGESWNVTKGGMDLFIAQHNGTFLGLDEANLAGDTPEERAKLIAHAVHMIVNGAPKMSKKMVLKKRPSSLVCVSTSNDSLSTLLKGSKQSRGAIAARFVTIHIPEGRPYGVFSSLPDGYENSRAMVMSLNKGISEQHGTPIRRFLQRLVDERKNHPKELQADIREYCERFYEAVGVDKNEALVLRRAEKFALAYAANKLARRWGCLPRRKAVGNYLEAFKTVWSWTLGVVEKRELNSPIDQLKAYAKGHDRSFLPANRPRKLSFDRFQTSLGFKRRSVAGRKELILSPKRFSSFQFSMREIAELRSAGIIIGEKGYAARNDTKRVVRCDADGQKIKERVFVIDVDQLRRIARS